MPLMSHGYVNNSVSVVAAPVDNILIYIFFIVCFVYYLYSIIFVMLV